MAKYDQGGGCACGLYKECDCMGSVTKELAQSEGRRDNVWRLMIDGKALAEYPTRTDCEIAALACGYKANDPAIVIAEGKSSLSANDNGVVAKYLPPDINQIPKFGRDTEIVNLPRGASVFPGDLSYLGKKSLAVGWLDSKQAVACFPARHVQPVLIAIYGPAGCGKSTVAQYLAGKGAVRHRFADTLKDMMRVVGLSEAEIEGDKKETPTPILLGRTPRHAMQTIGTEWGRDAIHPDFWISIWARKARKSLASNNSVVVEDLRFANEAVAVRALGGVVVAIQGRGEFTGTHISEAGGVRSDYVVQNDGDLANLHAQIDEFWLGLQEQQRRAA